LAGDPTVVAHERVDETQLAPAADGLGIVWRKVIEDFGFDAAQHEKRVGWKWVRRKGGGTRKPHSRCREALDC